jgi:hypothetical protein
MIDGQKIRMGGQEWTVPPLTLGQMKRLAPKLALLAQAGAPSAMTAEQIDAIAETVAVALSRNYPEMTSENVLDLLDGGNTVAVYAAVLTGSGLRLGEGRGEEEIAVKAGTAKSSAEPWTASTEPLPPAAATPSP